MVTSQPTDQTLTFLRHSSLDLPITIKISSLEGTRPQATLLALLENPALKHCGVQQNVPSDIYVIIQLFSNGQMISLPYQTSHKSFSGSNITWNEIITLPIKYRDLSRDSRLVVTVYDIQGPRKLQIVGGSSLGLFGKKSTLKKGKQRLFIHPGLIGDGSIAATTPSKIGLKDEMGRLEKLVKKFERGDIGRLDWLDKITFRNIEKIHSVSSGTFE